MSLNSLLIDSGSKGWADLYIDTLKVYNDAIFCGDVEIVGNITLDNLNVESLQGGNNGDILHTNQIGEVVWEDPSNIINTGCFSCEEAPNPLIGGGEPDKLISLSSANTDIQVSNVNNSAGSIVSGGSDIIGDVYRSGSIYSLNSTINANATDINQCALIGSNASSMLNNCNSSVMVGSLNSSMDNCERCVMNGGQVCTMLGCTRSSIQDSRDCDMENCQDVMIVASRNLNVSGLDRSVIGGNGSINWSLNSETGDITATGDIVGSTLSGTLQESDITPGSNGDILVTVGGTPTWRSGVGASVNARWVLATNMSPDAEELVSFDIGSSVDNGGNYITLGANLLRANVDGTYLITCYWSHDSGPTLSYYVNIVQNGIGGTVLCARYNISDRTTTMTFVADLSSGDTIGAVKRKSNLGDPTLSSNTSSEIATSMISMVKLI